MDAASLSRRLRARTQDAHRSVERTAFMRTLLGGELSGPAYGLLLHNLLALYRALEEHLERHAARTEIAAVFDARLRRVPALEQDVEIFGADRAELVPETVAYVERLDTIAREQPHRLVAHAYVRYLGDLSGGQMLDGIVQRTIAGAEETGRAFYDFGGAEIVRDLAGHIRTGLDSIDAALHEDIVDEAVAAFAAHQALFAELELQRSRMERMRS